MTQTKVESLFDQAVLLIWVAEKAIGKRRRIEAGCGYPDEYGDDSFLYQRLKTFLALPLVDARAKKLLSDISK